MACEESNGKDSAAGKKVYFMGIGGIAMGTLATMLKEKGYEVTGSDQNLYPPMSVHLDARRIPVRIGFNEENLRCSPDVVVIGNVIRRDNPEARYVLDREIPYLSMPQAIERFFLKSHKSIVVAGTHGKSTTSALLAWVLAHGGLDPSAFIGAILKNWESSFRLGSGPYMVLEGDEYDTAFFDKGPKFLHYRPHIGIITGVEFDHADIFRDFDAVLDAFRQFVKIIPPEGFLLINGDDPHCRALAKECKGKVVSYGCEGSADWHLVDAAYGLEEVRFRYEDPAGGRNEMVSRLAGLHNVSNSLAVLAAASLAGLPPEKIREALLAFRGIKRRQDVVGECGGVVVIDDFAHHPTAVRETIRAIGLFYPGRRIIAVFEPRTNSSRRNVFEDAYATAFDDAGAVCIKHPPDMEKIPEAERLDVPRLIAKIAKRRSGVSYFETTEAMVGALSQSCLPGDVVLCMSNGSFDGFPRKLLDALRVRGAQTNGGEK